MSGNGIYDQTRPNLMGDIYLFGGVPDPTVVATAAPVGGLYIRVGRQVGDPQGLYYKLDNGKTTNWKLIPTKFQINGVDVTNEPLNFVFTGAGVTVTDNGDGSYTVDIPGGGGGGSPIAVQDDNIEVVNPLTILNFGDQLTVTDEGAGKATIGLNLSSFQEKFYRVEPQVLRADGNASKTTFKDTSTASLSSGGTSSYLWTIPLINYVAGNDLLIYLDFIADGAGGPNRNVDTELQIEVFSLGDDIDTLTPVIKADLHAVPSTDGVTYRRSFTFTAAELGSLADGDYYVKCTYSRFANSPQDNFNRNTYVFLGRAVWG